MRYEGQIYRPPGERKSYLLQVTVGCSHTRCSFCGMYKADRYHRRPLRDILEDIQMARDCYGDVSRVFLCDGDAIALPTEDLLTILHALYTTFPSLEKVGLYAGPRSTLQKTPAELSALRRGGLTRAYLGVETGNAALLRAIQKGVDPAEMLEAGQRLRDAGIDLWIMILLGLAGHGAALTHCADTVRIINAMRPRHVSLLSLMLVPGTELYRDWQAGRFEPADKRELLEEARQILAGLEVDPLHFTCDHASNYLPLKGSLPEDKAAMLAALDAALSGQLRTRPDWSRGV